MLAGLVWLQPRQWRPPGQEVKERVGGLATASAVLFEHKM